MNSEAPQSAIEAVEQESSVSLNLEKLARGIDNYHVDIRLSKKFTGGVRKLVPLLISQLAVPKPKNWDNSTLYKRLRNSYLDLMTVLIHRVKTDLSADEICFLQFATIKYIINQVRNQLDNEIKNVSARLSEYRNKGSSEALAADQRLFWLKKNYDAILYSINKQLFSQLQRVEERQLAPIRQQFLGDDYSWTVKVLINPMLYVSELSTLPLLLNEYCAWSWNSDDKGFIELNEKTEKLLNKRLKPLEISPLGASTDSENTESEIHDELGGLFQTQAFFGPARDSKMVISETLNWFENPDNIDWLFNPQKNSERLRDIRQKEGLGAWWRARGECNKFRRTLKAFARQLRPNKVLAQLIATQSMRRSLNPIILENVELKVVCQYVAGQIPLNKLQDKVSGNNKLSPEQIKSLDELKDKIKQQVKKADEQDSMKVMMEFSRYRRDLKFYRFAHRAFNRLSLLTDEDELKLSNTAGTLYQMPTGGEIEEDEERICHHAILKADVRGSTTVTDELQNKGLNPASYFSMRFFNPINKILETYGANKVFIEGDAIILSFLEYENTPQQWFSVARACGYARDMIKIVSSNNRYSNQMGLPLLELGVGICYSDEAPRFLYDEDKPIMISGAIGLADRMSSCSWNLRAALKKTLFNIDVLRIADGEKEKGEKGQHFVRYNVNGILIDDVAMAKLREEISLKPIRMKLNGKEYLFHVGQYPDVNGRKKDLIIREGVIGIWRNNEIQVDESSSDPYYEVVVNRKVVPLVLDAANRKQTATV